jgi:signal transduction histidine kinase
VLGRPHALEQVLAHLVQNAVDASGEDSPVMVVLGQSGGRRASRSSIPAMA